METTTTASSTSVKKFSLSSVSFLVAILLFLLPFVEIKCNDRTLASNTGIGLAFGTNYKTTQVKSLENPFDTDSSEKNKLITEKQKGDMYVAALIALILGLIGLILSITSPQTKAGVFIAGLAAICLIILMIQIQMDIKDTPKNRDDSFSSNIKVTAQFTAWYYLSLISFIAAAFFSYRKKPIVISS